MENDKIVYEDLKIKNFDDVVIPEPFQPLYEAESHYFNLNKENFETTVNFFKKFITDGPGETQANNFKYLLELFVDGDLVQCYPDNLHFQILQTLGKIFNPIIRTRNLDLYHIAYNAGINIMLPPELAKLHKKPEMTPREPPDELTQIMLDDDVAKFQQHFDKSNPNYFNIVESVLIQNPSVNIVKYLLISGDFEQLLKQALFSKSYLATKIVSSGNIEIIRLLEQNGIKYNYCLSEAFKTRNSDLITWLLENYKQYKPSYVYLSFIKSIIFCLENNNCSDYSKLIAVYFRSKFKSVLEFFIHYKQNLTLKEQDYSFPRLHDEADISIISDCLINERYDYFNILYDLGLCYSDGFLLHPLSFLIFHKIHDLDLYEKVYQLTQRNTSTIFELPKRLVQDVLPDMDLMKFFLERKIITPNLPEILTWSGLDEMIYIFDHFQSFNVKQFNSEFNDEEKFLDFKPDLVDYIVRNYQIDLEGNNGFYIMKFAFFKGHIDLIVYLLDKNVILFRKKLKEEYKNRKKEKHNFWNNFYYGYKEEEEEEDEYEYEFDDPRYNFYNVMDCAEHDNLEAYQLILSHGGKAHAKGSEYCNTLLDYHSMNGNFEIIKILIEHGAKVTENTLELCSDDKSMCFLIDHADEYMLYSNLCLLINGDDKPTGFFNYVKKYSLNSCSLEVFLMCLSKALQVKNESVSIFILKNTEIDSGDYLDQFPSENDHWLIKAIEMNSPECVRLLLNLMEKCELIKGYFTPRIIPINDYYVQKSRQAIIPDYYLQAAKLNNIDIVKILIEHKVPINRKSDDILKNALFWAAVRENVDIINLLFEYGYEKLDIPEEDISMFHIHPDLVKLIRK